MHMGGSDQRAAQLPLTIHDLEASPPSMKAAALWCNIEGGTLGD